MLFASVHTLASALYPSIPDRKDLMPGTCCKVVDGDPLASRCLTRGPVVHSFRLTGVDAPETVHPSKPAEPYGLEASGFTTQSLLHQQVYIEYDLVKKDIYGRHLCHVWLKQGISSL